jgi:DNA recombination-dependent growth factor C
MEIRPFATFRRFELAERWEWKIEETLKRLEKKKFLPLDAAHEETERAGWITLEHLFDTRFEIEKIYRDPYLCFALRIDRRKIPANLLRAHAKIEEQAQRNATGKPVGPAKRREIREQVREMLTAKVLPSAASYPVVLAPNRGMVWFSNAGQKAGEAFVAHFEETFEIALIPQTPRHLALRTTRGDAEAIDRAVPATFAERPALAATR